MTFISKNKYTIVGIIIGAIGGYIYHSYIGCTSGYCAITSEPVNSTIYGAVMSGLFFNLLRKEK